MDLRCLKSELAMHLVSFILGIVPQRLNGAVAAILANDLAQRAAVGMAMSPRPLFCSSSCRFRDLAAS